MVFSPTAYKLPETAKMRQNSAMEHSFLFIDSDIISAKKGKGKREKVKKETKMPKLGGVDPVFALFSPYPIYSVSHHR
jgi:hypothetical protein